MDGWMDVCTMCVTCRTSLLNMLNFESHEHIKYKNQTQIQVEKTVHEYAKKLIRYHLLVSIY